MCIQCDSSADRPLNISVVHKKRWAGQKMAQLEEVTFVCLSLTSMLVLCYRWHENVCFVIVHLSGKTVYLRVSPIRG